MSQYVLLISPFISYMYENGDDDEVFWSDHIRIYESQSIKIVPFSRLVSSI